MKSALRVLPVLLLAGCATTTPADRALRERALQRDYCLGAAADDQAAPPDCEAYAEEMGTLRARAVAEREEELAAIEEARQRRAGDPVGYCIRDAESDYEGCAEGARARARERNVFARSVFQQQVIATELQSAIQQCGARQTSALARCESIARPAEAPPETSAADQ